MNTDDPPKVNRPRATSMATAARVGRCRCDAMRSGDSSREVPTKASGIRWMTPRPMNTQSDPARSITDDNRGEATVPTRGPITAMSPVRSSSPNTSAHAIQAMAPSERPLTTRTPMSATKGTRAEVIFAAAPRRTAHTTMRRRGRNSRPAPHEATTKPANWAVEMMPTRPGRMS